MALTPVEDALALVLADLAPVAIERVPLDRVAGRVLAQRWCGRPLDAVAHPFSVLAVLGLLASSWVGRVRGTLSWKGRAV